MEAILSCEMSILTRATRRKISQNGILHGNVTSNFMNARNFLTSNVKYSSQETIGSIEFVGMKYLDINPAYTSITRK
jgi:hypothetical protein